MISQYTSFHCTADIDEIMTENGDMNAIDRTIDRTTIEETEIATVNVNVIATVTEIEIVIATVMKIVTANVAATIMMRFRDYCSEFCL